MARPCSEEKNQSLDGYVDHTAVCAANAPRRFFRPLSSEEAQGRRAVSTVVNV